MTNLVVRLNTYESINNATAEEKKYGRGIYADFGDESEKYKTGTFKKVIDSVLEQALNSEEESYRNIAQGVQNQLAEADGTVKLFEIMVYNPKDNTYFRNASNEASMVMSLDDYVKDYIIEKDLSDGEESGTVDYLDIVTVLNSPVGKQ